MEAYYKDLLLNIFLIFCLFAFYPFIYKMNNKVLMQRTLIYVLFAFALITTMSFPLQINGLLYDFRSIPLVAGSLYGGLYVSILLYLTLILYRYIIGNPNDLIYIVSILPSFIIIVLYLKKFNTFNLLQKITLSMVLCTAVKLIAFTIYVSLTHQFELFINRPAAHIQTYIVQAVIVGLCIFLIEFLNKYFCMQDEVINNDKLKIVSEMAASVAHEIRNPLTSVRGFIQLLGTADLSREKKDFYQKISLEELDRAQTIISDYLSLAKPDPEIIEKINIQDELVYLSNVLLTYANYNNIQINRSSEEGPIHIVGDRYKFRQAVINIGKNAIESMGDGGILEIKASVLRDKAVITICDTGIGMTPEQILRLGTPYYSTKERGTGLGSMVSFSIIKKMNGIIEIKSEMNKGTKYKLIFPNFTND